MLNTGARHRAAWAGSLPTMPGATGATHLHHPALGIRLFVCLFLRTCRVIGEAWRVIGPQDR
eukprot:521982-Heterocapsa_arctica.AAC.1